MSATDHIYGKIMINRGKTKGSGLMTTTQNSWQIYSFEFHSTSFLLAASRFAVLQRRAAGYIFTCGKCCQYYTQKPSEQFPKQGSLSLKEIVINEQEKIKIISLNINTGQI